MLIGRPASFTSRWGGGGGVQWSGPGPRGPFVETSKLEKEKRSRYVGVAIVDHRSIELWRVKKRDWILESFFFFSMKFLETRKIETKRNARWYCATNRLLPRFFFSIIFSRRFYRRSSIHSRVVVEYFAKVSKKRWNEFLPRSQNIIVSIYPCIDTNIPLWTSIISTIVAITRRKFRNEAARK